MEHDADGVENAAGHEQGQSAPRQRRHERVNRRKHRPALHQVKRDRQSLEIARREKLERNADSGDGPHHGKENEPERRVHLDEDEGRVGARNHQEDGGVVKAPQPLFEPWRPGYEIVARGKAEGRNQGKPVNAQTHDPQGRIRLDADDEKNGQRDETRRDADDMEAAVSDALAERVFGK
jgi:hypothetical protein